MLSTIFIILMFAVVVDFFWLAIKLAWSVGKLILSFIFFPVAMILLATSGLITAALMILLIVGIIALIFSFAKWEKTCLDGSKSRLFYFLYRIFFSVYFFKKNIFIFRTFFILFSILELHRKNDAKETR